MEQLRYYIAERKKTWLSVNTLLSRGNSALSWGERSTQKYLILIIKKKRKSAFPKIAVCFIILILKEWVYLE